MSCWIQGRYGPGDNPGYCFVLLYGRKCFDMIYAGTKLLPDATFSYILTTLALFTELVQGEKSKYPSNKLEQIPNTPGYSVYSLSFVLWWLWY